MWDVCNCCNKKHSCLNQESYAGWMELILSVFVSIGSTKSENLFDPQNPGAHQATKSFKRDRACQL